MKFNIGEWVTKPGVKLDHCEQIREYRLSEDKTRLWLYGVSYRENRRSLDGVAFELEISSPQPDIIRTEVIHHRGYDLRHTRFDICDAHSLLSVDINEEELEVRSGDTRLIIRFHPAEFKWFYQNRMLTAVGDRFGRPMIGFVCAPEGPFMRVQLDIDIDEHIFGLGERFTPFVRNGQVIDIWNEDGGTASEISYKNVPFYITDKGYGIFVCDTGPVSFEVCSEHVERVQISSPGNRLDFMVIGGSDMKDVLTNYTALTGRPGLPPAWSFGLWLSSSFTTSYDEKTVLSFIDGMIERGIPLSVFHFDCFWMKENEWCGFQWDSDMFPDVEGLLKKIHDRGVRVCVWINPYIAQKSPVFSELLEKGLLLSRPDGRIWQRDQWQSGLAIYDFTNPDTVAWYKEQLKRLMRQGVDSFKTDFGERIPTDCVWFDGSDPVRMHNYYSFLYNRIVYEAICEERGEEQACLFARSATAGSQRFPVHWGGDCNSTYHAMAESLRGGLSLCLSGFGFWSHDIGGFEGTAPEDVYKRWLAFGLLSTHSRLHGSDSYRVPWLFGQEAVDVCRHFTRLKCKLMPYLYSCAVESARTGVPVMRATVLEFNEIGARTCDQQYMLGDALLVAPVLRRDHTVDVYLPEGRWTNYFTGETIDGQGWRTENHDFYSLPLYVRGNRILPIGKCDDCAVYDYEQDVMLAIYAPEEEKTAERAVVDNQGKEAFKVSCVREGNKLTICFTPKPIHAKVWLPGCFSARIISGAVRQEDSRGFVFSVTGETVLVEIIGGEKC
ncbi:MAG: alpha-xylosidase [Clostridiaceae bacterium]|nr:alpha-xylosidase [Clostridiaceae bacterium]